MEMDRRTRLELMTQALATLAGSDWGDFVLFEDLQTRDYVQLAVAPSVGEADGSVPCHVSLPLTADESIPKAQMEVTDRGVGADGPPPGMPPLGPSQIAAIEHRGFALSNHPNYTVFIDLDHVDAIAAECEHLFRILGSSASFELGVTIHVS
jgi:hypothetical protein